MKIQLHNAVVEKIQTMADGSIQVRLGLPELPPEQMTQLFSNMNKSTNVIEVNQVTDGKSPSQRLRSVLYVLWQTEYKVTYPEFAVFYASKMENWINKIKEKLV